jgi:hypothetical protein
MIHHFINRGYLLSDLLEMDEVTKQFMKASMLLFYEEEAKRSGTG